MIAFILLAVSLITSLIALAGIFLPLSSWGIPVGFPLVFGSLATGLFTTALYLIFYRGNSAE